MPKVKEEEVVEQKPIEEVVLDFLRDDLNSLTAKVNEIIKYINAK